MPELAVLIPTRGRPGNIRKVIGAWDFTSAWDAADMVLIADADDPEIEGYRRLVQEVNDGSAIQDFDPPVTLIEIPKWMPMVHKLDAAARDLADRYWALGFAGDDHLPQTIGWAKRYLEVLHELQTGMVYSDDGYQGGNLSTEWAITSDVVHELGRMVPAPVEHMYCDNSIMELFRAAGALRYLPEVRIEHMHPIVGKAETDEQYKRVNHRDQFRKDRAAYDSWRNGQMSADVATVKALRDGLPEVRPELGRSTLTPGSTPKRVIRRSRPSSERPVMSNRLPVPRELRKVVGATPDEIGLTLADFAIGVPADQAIVEIGVYQARTALLMAWGARQGNGAHVWAIDPWEKDGNVYDPPFTEEGTRRWAEYNVQATGYSRDVTLIHQFSHVVSDEWATDRGAKRVGLLFVDGDHTKEGAKRDILGWAPHLAPGATIAVDDYHHPDWPGVAEAVDELVAEGVLEPVQVFHDRLAVTKLTTREEWATTGHAAEPIGNLAAETPEQSAAIVDGNLREAGSEGLTSITSEGVSPSPYPAVAGQVAEQRQMVDGPHFPAEPDAVDLMFDGPAQVGPDTQVSTGRGTVQPEEALFVNASAGQMIDALNITDLKALAKHRGVVLGARKDKKELILAALRDGK
jgi:hypothetical protein